MGNIAIHIEGLSKQYRIGALQRRSSSLKDAVGEAARRAGQALLGRGRASRGANTIWAVQDVTLDVAHGEVLGIIGRNGAGKSTLLKILARITAPTCGSVDLYGRVGSLLEVGTGFHSELTGRENVFLYGAILGMRRTEIECKFEQIVQFAEVERFIDTPVKRYSSGMYMRLAFAVAAHLEPEILLVDEVLAVGDAAFQKKCLGVMGDVARQGRTVLFVSHNMAAVRNLCTRAILLDQGRVVQDGDTGQVLTEYFSRNIQAESGNRVDLRSHPGMRPGGRSILQEIWLETEGLESSTVRMGSDLTMTIPLKSEAALGSLRLHLFVEDMTGQRLFSTSTLLQAPQLLDRLLTEATLKCRIERLRLLPGIYYLSLSLANGPEELEYIERAISFTVESDDVFGTGFAPGNEFGIFFEDAVWNLGF
jgi:lipopolysaccharide transport system ATP-binding protein